MYSQADQDDNSPHALCMLDTLGYKHKFIFFFFVALRPNAGHGLLIHEVF
jgi:hypothetical protein